MPYIYLPFVQLPLDPFSYHWFFVTDITNCSSSSIFLLKKIQVLTFQIEMSFRVLKSLLRRGWRTRGESTSTISSFRQIYQVSFYIEDFRNKRAELGADFKAPINISIRNPKFEVWHSLFTILPIEPSSRKKFDLIFIVFGSENW